LEQRTLPYISICIPTYKNVSFLKRLLDSISIQTYRDYEVIISDDSPDNSVEKLVTSYKDKIAHIIYLSNSTPRGMPDNWNHAIAKSKGEWKKIMHDDDWFADEESLSLFAQAAQQSKASFIFSNYINKNLENARTKHVVFPRFKLASLERVPLLLMSGNLIGPPSVTMVHQKVLAKYNPQLHWLVDIDYYIQILLKKNEVVHINKELVYIGVNQEQITKAVKNNPAIEIGEAKKLLDLYGNEWLRDIRVYDGWWRLFRNMKIKSFDQLVFFGGKDWPNILKQMLHHQQGIPASLLKKGIFSKLFMVSSYLRQLNNIKSIKAK